MKKSLLALAILAAAGAASAQSSFIPAGGYAIIGLGQSKLDIDCGPINCDKKNLGGKIVIGKPFGTSGFAGELGYLYYGEAKGSFGAANAKASGHSFALGAAYTYDMSRFSATGRAGFAANYAKYEVNVPGFSEDGHKTKVKPYFGAGIGFKPDPTTTIGLDWDRTKFEVEGESAKVNMWTVTFKRSF